MHTRKNYIIRFLLRLIEIDFNRGPTFLFFLLGSLFLPTLLLAKLHVVTTTEDLASITRSVAGDLADVSSIARGTQDPHYIEAKPSFLVTVSRANLVIA